VHPSPAPIPLLVSTLQILRGLNLCLVFDLLFVVMYRYAENGSLGQTLTAFGKLDEKLVESYVIKILNGLDYIHRNGVVHCNLRADNILTTRDGVKLAPHFAFVRLRRLGPSSPARPIGRRPRLLNSRASRRNLTYGHSGVRSSNY